MELTEPLRIIIFALAFGVVAALSHDGDSSFLKQFSLRNFMIYIFLSAIFVAYVLGSDYAWEEPDISPYSSYVELRLKLGGTMFFTFVIIAFYVSRWILYDLLHHTKK